MTIEYTFTKKKKVKFRAVNVTKTVRSSKGKAFPLQAYGAKRTMGCYGFQIP
jgi:hypothetical protein